MHISFETVVQQNMTVCDSGQVAGHEHDIYDYHNLTTGWNFFVSRFWLDFNGFS